MAKVSNLKKSPKRGLIHGPGQANVKMASKGRGGRMMMSMPKRGR